jgi:hypothetical protein
MKDANVTHRRWLRHVKLVAERSEAPEVGTAGVSHTSKGRSCVKGGPVIWGTKEFLLFFLSKLLRSRRQFLRTVFGASHAANMLQSILPTKI